MDEVKKKGRVKGREEKRRRGEWKWGRERGGMGMMGMRGVSWR